MVTERTTRRPTGKPSWPFIQLSGLEQSGKTWALLEASADPRIGRFLYVPFGEYSADEYGAIPGVDFEIVDHDGTYRDLFNAVAWAVSQPRLPDGRPNAVALDSGSPLWGLLSSEADKIARGRAAKKATRYGRNAPGADDEVQITMDLWNGAKERWNAIINLLSSHDGPAFITTRLEEVAVVDGNGEPTKERKWKPVAEKMLPYAVTATVQFRAYRHATLTGVKSVHMGVPLDDSRSFPNFTVSALFDQLHLGDGSQVEGRQFTRLDAQSGANEITAPVNSQEVVDALNSIATSANPLVGLQEIRSRWSDDALATVQYQRRDGSTVSAGQQWSALTQWAKRAASAQAEDSVSTQATPDGEQEVASERAPETAPVSAQPERDPRAIAAQEAAEATQARLQAEANRGPDTMTMFLFSELRGQADVLGIPLDDHVAPLIELANASDSTVTTLSQVKPLRARRYVLDQRARVIEALREQGRASEAETYEAHRAAGEVKAWERLVGTADPVPTA